MTDTERIRELLAENCGAIGGNDLKEKDAVIAWNTRAGENDE